MRLERYKHVHSQAKNRPTQRDESSEVEGDEKADNVELVVRVEEGVCMTRKNSANNTTEDLSLAAGARVYHLLGDADCEYGIRPDVSESDDNCLGTSMTCGSRGPSKSFTSDSAVAGSGMPFPSRTYHIH